MNFTRWSARLPGTQRRAAARSDRTAGGSVPTARGERPDSARQAAAASASGSAVEPPGVADGGAHGQPAPTLGGTTVHDILGQVPALVAVVYGPEHRIAYVNEAYAALFGARTPGTPARQALPELGELGLLPLMDQVLRSGKPRTVKSRRIPSGGFAAATEAAHQQGAHSDGNHRARPHGEGRAAHLSESPRDTAPTGTADAGAQAPAGPNQETVCTGGRNRDGYYTFTCTPIEVTAPAPVAPAPPAPASAADSGTATDSGTDGGPGTDGGTDAEAVAPRAVTHRGVLVFGADVTDQVEAAERLRASERRQRDAAVTLQRSLLPQELEQPDDLRIAATYRPGGEDAAVGGDWYDVITLGAGRTALVIGDVMGRGVRAAAVMGQLRTAVRAYARLDLPPHEVLQLLDGLAAEIDASQIATCVYAVHDPNEGRLVYASAGHLPILVRDPDGTVRRAAEPTGPPLGTGGWLHTSGSVPLGPGSSAVLYTDGLVERRDKDIDDGVAELERAFTGATGTPQVMCDRLIRALGITEEHDDDVAVLVVQHPERTGHDAELFHNAALELLGGVEAAPRARAFASGVLASWRFPTELRDLGVLAASELVANSLQHGTPPMRLRLRRTDRRLIVEVTDGDDHLPRRRRAEPADEAGRGISIIATIASSWGSRRTPGGGKAVWCEFALPAG
ncbi:ATP-binding SpoIIE family protein phosphatase [Streptomyces sp. XD-27]|uniref:ATP-binding SpoIIE family protein phosphatase n=1 Tax=Streptomyces sp. XD-27 TaxID=3062779 RepID=UPI0026F45E9D|nr:ATP-binding SpoIIE family protein phosphatase [Streptomyces sp. XD-27]WKX71188.1 serine/threonine-protein phosphatase [Streptomyces sp. XD-27]